MKKFMLVAAMGALVLAAPAAWSQNAAGSPPAGGGQPPAMGPGGAGGPPQDNMKFADRKADILNHINQHLAEATQRKQCVEAAQTREALRACMPEREPRGGNGGPGRGGMPENGQGGPGGQGEPQGGSPQ